MATGCSQSIIIIMVATPLPSQNPYPHLAGMGFGGFFHGFTNVDGSPNVRKLVTCNTYCTISINSSGTVMRDAPDENMVSATSQFCCDMSEIFGRLALQATNFIYIRHIIAKWFRHFAKMTVTIVTFRRFWKARDAWPTNWLKWYSITHTSQVTGQLIAHHYKLYGTSNNGPPQLPIPLWPVKSPMKGESQHSSRSHTTSTTTEGWHRGFFSHFIFFCANQILFSCFITWRLHIREPTKRLHEDKHKNIVNKGWIWQSGRLDEGCGSRCSRVLSPW
jgi:hypothetical protein